jgi:hypothetical protein
MGTIRFSAVLATLFLCSCAATRTVAPQMVPNPATFVRPSAGQVPEIFVGIQYANASNYPEQSVLVFPRTANGNVAPLRRLPKFALDNGAVTRAAEFFPGGSVIGLYTAAGVLAKAITAPNSYTVASHFIDKFGNYYETTGYDMYSNYCDLKGDVTLRKYAARSGGRRLIRTIDLGQPCYVSAMAVDDEGNTYVGEEHGSFSGIYNPIIAIYAGNNDGPNPTRILSLSQRIDIGNGIGGIGVDRGSDIFVQLEDQVLRFPKGYGPSVTIATTHYGGNFAVDDAGYVYVVKAIWSSGYASLLRFVIRVYVPGKHKPIRIIAGDKTLIGIAGTHYYSATIGVVPQR